MVSRSKCGFVGIVANTFFIEMQIQELKHADLSFVANLQPADWGDITPHLKHYIDSAFCFPVKAVTGSDIAGVGAVILHNDVAWLAHIIVHPGYRSIGTGTLITQTLIDIAHANHCETVYLIATDLGIPVYKKLGFETETEYIGFKDGLLKPDKLASYHVMQFDEGDLAQVMALDKMATGENRRASIEKHLPHAYIYQAKQQVEGFYLPSFGEGLIIAANAVAGIALMNMRFEKNSSAILPAGNKTGIEFLLQNGYKEFTRRKRMILGKPRAWNPSAIYNRIGGQIG